MKQTITYLAVAAITLSFSAVSIAADAEKAGKDGKPKLGQVVKQYDADKNHKLEGDEVKAVRDALAADAASPLKALDKDKSGQIEDAEIAAFNEHASKPKKKKKDK